MMNQNSRVVLVRRSLALKHKLKVHDSLPCLSPHEDLAKHLLTRWEREDELQAIEECFILFRKENIQKYKKAYESSKIACSTTESLKAAL